MTTKKSNKRFAVISVIVACAFIFTGLGLLFLPSGFGSSYFTNTATIGILGDTRATAVALPLYSVQSDTSSFEYGTYKSAEHGTAPSALTGDVTGLKVALAQGDVLEYKKVIDLNDFGKDEQLITFCITPGVIGVEDVGVFEVIFTDAYDPSNKITVNISKSIDRDSTHGLVYANSYVKAAATGQQLTGWEWNYNKKHVANSYGYPVRLSFAGVDVQGYGINTIANNSFNLSVDYAERELYSTVRAASASKKLICDLDSGDDFSTLWQGFTTGECFVSFRASDYAKDKANFVITKIGDQQMDELTFTDRGTPIVKVDTLSYYENDLPEAVKGKAYPLFAASCVSPYFGALEVVPSVKFGGSEVSVKNNSFVPSETGEYTVTYTAKDPYDVSGSVSVTVKATEATEPLEFAIASGDYASQCFAGELVAVPLPTVTGGSGKPTVTVTVRSDSGSDELESSSFRPRKEGTYKIIFKATDYIGQTETYEHTLGVDAGDKPVFTQDAVLPHYFVSGAEYVLPELDAYDYTDGSGKAVSSSISVTDANGTKTVRGGRITPVIKRDGDIVTVTYTATIRGKSSQSKSYEIPAVSLRDDERYISLGKLLYSPDSSVVSIAAEEEGTLVTAAKSAATVDFINPLPAHGFEFSFCVPAGGASFGAVKVTLIDADDPDIRLEFVYRKFTAYTAFEAAGVTSVNRAAQRFGSDDTFALSYNALRNEISFDPTSKQTVAPVQLASGGKFTGFPSGKVYLGVVFENVTGVSRLLVLSVGGQYLTSDPLDFVEPRVAVLGDVGGSKDRGSVVTLPAAIACDGVDYTISFSLTVLDPDGVPVTATDGTLLSEVADCSREYGVKLDKIGAYRVLYTAVDSSDNRTDSGSYILQVVDVQKPVITVNGTPPSTGNVGKQITVPSASASDDSGEEIAVKIYLVTSKGQVIELNDRAFTPKSAGKYVVRYWCADSVGNITVIDYAVTVA